MIFNDRHDAGKKLSNLLLHFAKTPNTIVIGLPRGGVVIAYEIARCLKIPMDIICPRKIGSPFNRELAIGAVTETGEAFFNDSIISYLEVSKEFLQEATEAAQKQAQYQYELYRKNHPPIDLKNKSVIICDDGLATGATMQAAIKAVRAKGAHKIIMAVPVAPVERIEKMRNLVDEVVCFEAQEIFYSVGEFYKDFSQVSDQEVIELLDQPDPV